MKTPIKQRKAERDEMCDKQSNAGRRGRVKFGNT